MRIPLGHGEYGYGWVLEEPLIAFLDHRDRDGGEIAIDDLIKKPVLFKLWVFNHAVTRGTWPVVGHAEAPAAVRELPWFFKQDALTGRLSMTQMGREGPPVTLEQASTLDAAAVWEPEHVAERLRDHFAGRPNKWVQVMRPKGRPSLLKGPCDTR